MTARFERAVIGALTLLAGGKHFTAQEIGAAYRSVWPFLDETPREDSEIPDAAIGLQPSPHRHDWVQYELPNSAIMATCSFCGYGTQLR